jgi:hypothetical protein
VPIAVILINFRSSYEYLIHFRREDALNGHFGPPNYVDIEPRMVNKI